MTLTPFEEKVSIAARRLLDEHGPVIRKAGLFADLRGIQVRDEQAGSRTSELEIVFLRHGEFADIFEFFVERDGKPAATLEEVEDWLRKELAELPARHSLLRGPSLPES